MTVEEEKKLLKHTSELLWENRVQTIAVLLFFFFSIATIQDIKKKIKP